MKKIIGLLTVIAMSWVTWNVWFPPETITEQADVRAWLPERPDMGASEQEKWRVFTRRMVWDQAVEGFKKRLAEKNIEAIVLKRKESVMLHVFDDPRVFKSLKNAEKAKKDWGIKEVDVLKRGDGTYLVGLGRFYLTAYAEQREDRLQKTGKKFVYKQRTKVIPTYRFIFPALPEKEAEMLWKNIQDMGAVDPVMMSENEFNAMFVGSQ
ncbi:MAG: hypothetical protein R8M46_06105 [Ghiorsea sp.]